MTESNRADIFPIPNIWSYSPEPHVSCRRWACTRERGNWVSWHQRQGKFRSCFHKSSIQPSAEQGRQSYACGKAIRKAIFALSMIQLHKSQEKQRQRLAASNGYPQTIPSVASNANAECFLSTQLGTIFRDGFYLSINCKQEKSQMARSRRSALKLSAPRWRFWTIRTDVCDCFPCTNAAQSLLGVVSTSGKLQH